MISYPPAEFGEQGQRHEVHVFLYRFDGDGPQYLLLQAEPKQEGLWRPVVGPIDLDEDLRHAALRQAHAELGLAQAYDFISPPWGLIDEIGDLQLVQWPIGLMSPSHWPRLALGDAIRDCDWYPFETALKKMDASFHRQNLLQLHLRLVG